MELLSHPAIYTDYYELTMAQGYFLSGNHERLASFDYFFRSNPFEGGFTIFAGLADFLLLVNTLGNSFFSVILYCDMASGQNHKRCLPPLS